MHALPAIAGLSKSTANVANETKIDPKIVGAKELTRSDIEYSTKAACGADQAREQTAPGFRYLSFWRNKGQDT
jgi:hypothetical protein